VAFLDASWKFIYREKASEAGVNKLELYDRRTDREEQKNLAAQNPQEVDRLLALTSKWMDAQKQIRGLLGQGAKATINRQTLQQLRSLGYIGGK